MTILQGHTSEATAYVNESYPYGFRLRCRKRYWVETNRNGQRVWSQTSNPKVAGDPWNKPKAGIYHDVAILYLDDAGHVQVAALQATSGPDAFAAFHERHGDALAYLQSAGSADAVKTIDRIIMAAAVSRKFNRESWAMHDARKRLAGRFSDLRVERHAEGVGLWSAGRYAIAPTAAPADVEAAIAHWTD